MRTLLALFAAAMTSAMVQDAEPLVIYGYAISDAGDSMFIRVQLSAPPGRAALQLAMFGRLPVAFTDVDIAPDTSTLQWTWPGRIHDRCELERRGNYHWEGLCRSEGGSRRVLLGGGYMPDLGQDLPPGPTDLAILDRAQALLASEAEWDRDDTRVCEGDHARVGISLFCALYRASLEVTGEYLHNRPALRAPREVIWERARDRVRSHTLRDFNNHRRTSFEEIREVLDQARERLRRGVVREGISRRDTTFAFFGGENFPVELLELAVPEVRRDTGAADTILIRALRFPSTAPSTGPPVFYLAGGPGSSAFVDARAMQAIITTLRSRGDFVAIAQRGTLGSEPHLACPATARYPDDMAATWDRLEGFLRAAARSCVQHWAERGVDLRGYHTRAIAEDIEDLRLALGSPRVNLWAWSYGTQVALELMRTHPEGVNRAVLISLHPLDGFVRKPAATEAAFLRLDSLWSEHPVFGRATSTPRRILRDWLERLDQAPARVRLENPSGGPPREVVVGAFDLQRVVGFAVNRRGSTEGGLPALLLGLMEGDLTPLGDWARSFRRWHGNAMALGVACATGLPPDFWNEARAEAHGSLLGVAPSFSELQVCDVVPHAGAGPALRSWFRSAVPILFVDPEWGTRPPSLADSLAVWMPASRRLYVEWGFHAELEPWESFAPPILAFLDARPLPYDTVRLAPPMPRTAVERLSSIAGAVVELQRRGRLTPEMAAEILEVLQPITSALERNDPRQAMLLVTVAVERVRRLVQRGNLPIGVASGSILGPLHAVRRELRFATRGATDVGHGA